MTIRSTASGTWVYRMKKILPIGFFQKPAPTVAKNLLGKVLVKKSGNKISKVVITETEAYLGSDDLASHARFGKTKRNAVMFGKGGCWYVYFVYGMHWLLNVITQKEGSPSGVLIRGGILLDKNIRTINGPARITKIMKINGLMTGRPASKNSGLWIEDWGIKVGKVISKKRIGVDYAGIWAKKLLRFVASKSFVKHVASLYN